MSKDKKKPGAIKRVIKKAVSKVKEASSKVSNLKDPKSKSKLVVYKPGYTKHWAAGSGADRYSEEKKKKYNLNDRGYYKGGGGSEGGQGGFIVERKKATKKGNTKSLFAGSMNNSYGDKIAVAGGGRSKSIGKRTKIGVDAGVTKGYGKSFRKLDKGGSKLYEGIKKTDLAPFASASIEHNFRNKKNVDGKSRTGIKAIVNPLYANLGLTTDLGAKKKKKNFRPKPKTRKEKVKAARAEFMALDKKYNKKK